MSRTEQQMNNFVFIVVMAICLLVVIMIAAHSQNVSFGELFNVSPNSAEKIREIAFL